MSRRNAVSTISVLGEVAEVQMGYPFRSRLEHEPLGDVAVIQMKDIDDTNLLHPEQATRVTLPHGKARHLLRTGDLVFRSRGRSNGAAHVVKELGPAVLAAPMLLVRPRKVLPEYLCWFLNAPSTQAQLAAVAEGTSVRMISAEALKSLPVPVPPLDLQRRIAEISALAQQEHTLLAEIAALRQRLATHLLMKLAHPSPERATQ